MIKKWLAQASTGFSQVAIANCWGIRRIFAIRRPHSWSVLTRQSAIRCAEARVERLCQQVAQLTRAVLMPPRVSSSHAAPTFVSCSAPQCGH